MIWKAYAVAFVVVAWAVYCAVAVSRFEDPHGAAVVQSVRGVP